MIVRAGFAVLAVALVAGGLAGCTSSGGKAPSSPAPVTRTAVTGTSTAPTSPASTAPVSTDPTTITAASSCPFGTTSAVMNAAGMRLGRITVLRSGGKVVGCRYYPMSQPDAQCDASCLKGEHLPPATQPVVEITTQHYAIAAAAHNAAVQLAKKGSHPQQSPLGHGLTADCFETAFYPKDHGTDWACAVNVGTTELVVHTVVTPPNLYDVTQLVQKIVAGL